MPITRAPRGPQTWFWRHSTWNFTRKKMRYLPRSVDLQISWKKTMSKKWTLKSATKHIEKEDPSKVEKKQCRKSGFIYAYIPSYAFIYLYTPPNSFIYLHIPSHTSKYWILKKIGTTKNTKMVITRVPSGPPWPEFAMHLPTISPKVFSCLKGIRTN